MGTEEIDTGGVLGLGIGALTLTATTAGKIGLDLRPPKLELCHGHEFRAGALSTGIAWLDQRFELDLTLEAAFSGGRVQ